VVNRPGAFNPCSLAPPLILREGTFFHHPSSRRRRERIPWAAGLAAELPGSEPAPDPGPDPSGRAGAAIQRRDVDLHADRSQAFVELLLRFDVCVAVTFVKSMSAISCDI
jgi:hypothetical protein